MTLTERLEGTRRLEELERSHALAQETLRDLRRWWQSKLREDERRVVSIDAWRQKREWSL